MTGVILASMVMLSAAASGRDPDLRLHLAHIRSDRQAVQRQSRAPGRVFSLLGQADRGNPQATRTRRYNASTGPINLTFVASRFRGGRTERGQTALSADRYSARMAGLDLGLDIGDGLRLQSELLLTHMKRHPAVVPNGFRPRSTGIGIFGVGIARETGPVLMLDYVRIGPSGRRTALERVTEIAGGAPLAGRGLRLGFVSSPDDVQRSQVQWGFALLSMRRPLSDSALGTASGTVPDNRAEFSVRMAY